MAVSLNSVDFRGCGERRPLGGGEDDYDPMAGTIVLRGLPAGGQCVFAVAAYDAEGGLIGHVGATSAPIVAALPLPRLHIWATLALSAAQLGCDTVALAAAAQVEASRDALAADAAVEQDPRAAAAERMVPLGLHRAARLVPGAAARRLAARGGGLARRRRRERQRRRARRAAARGAGGDARARQAAALALQLALAVDDGALSGAALQGLWNLIVPLLRLRRPRPSCCRCAPSSRRCACCPPSASSPIAARWLLACAAFALVRLSQQAVGKIG